MKTAEDLAGAYSRIVVENISRDFPFHTGLTYLSAEDVKLPREVHPAFCTSYDWHSCVHMHWLGVELLASGFLPEAEEAGLRAQLNTSLTAENLRIEANFLRSRPTFERPYGWAWAARLAASTARLAAQGDQDSAIWSAALEPLVEAVYQNTESWLNTIRYPVRHGVHSNTAFGLGLLIDAGIALGRDVEILKAAAVRFFGRDSDWAGRWELSGQDFLSAGLVEADLMCRVLNPEQFQLWWKSFLSPKELDSICQVAIVTDETDPQMSHLHGLNISRSGALYRLAEAVAEPELANRAEELLSAGLRAVDSGEYVSSHWLASFAWDALLSRP